MGKIIPDDVWFEMLEKNREDGLNASQISRLLGRKYGIFVSRQAVWSRLDNYKRFGKV